MYTIVKLTLKKYIVTVFFTTLFTCFFYNNIYADENGSSTNFGGFSIEGVKNVHQIDDSSGYFYLKENPNSTDKINIKLSNSSSKEKTLEIKVVNANTNSNGIIDYTGTISDNKILRNPLTNILSTGKKEIVVAPNSTIETTLNIKMPTNKFSGVIVGGIVVTEKKSHNKSQGTIGNDYSYTIGVVLTNEDKINLYSNLSVELQSVNAELSTGKKVVQANILNPNPYIFSKAEVKGAVYNEDGKTKLKENSLNNVSIAPYSALPFQLDWQKDDLKPGTYIFKGSVKTEENTWDFEKKFEIKNTEAKKINEESVFKVVLPTWFIYSGYLVILINIIGSFYIIIRKVKKHKLSMGGK